VSDLPPARRRVDPLLAVVVGVAVGIMVAALRQPQVGMFLVSGALAVGAVLRLVLRPRQAGSLVVRSRQVDVAVLAGLAIAVGVLAAVTPFPSDGG
jgi:preprotein translocase subunit Sec61beta